MSKLKGLDLFCGAGGASMGYHRAGFEMTGVDLHPQKNYPFTFVQADALDYLAAHGHEYDFIAASPPCQRYSTVTPKDRRNDHPELIAATRSLLRQFDVPYVIENVMGAPVAGTIMLCGSSFGLDVQRHRLFESNVLLFARPCNHSWQTPRFRSLDSRRRDRLARVVGVHGSTQYVGDFALRKRAMGIHWMTIRELSQAIPPAYTEYIGRQVIAVIERQRQEAA